MPTNIIVNGSFDQNPGDANFGWSGTDLETTYSENTYQSNGSNDSVAEMNGGANQTTVMQQTFSVAAGQTTDIEFEAALRSQNTVAGEDGFTVQITDDVGAVIFETTILPTTQAFQTFTFPVTFPSTGDYTLTFTEIGPNDSYGALIDDIAIMVCLTKDTLIDTPNGSTLVQDLRAGSIVDTLNGPRPLRWIGCKSLTADHLHANEKLRPVLIRADALGLGIPARDMRVSRQHRIMVSSVIAQRMFGVRDVLVSAIRLTDLPGIDVDKTALPTTYFHLLFDEHEVISADGAQTESLFAGPAAMEALSHDARHEILTLLPELSQGLPPAPAVHIPARREQIKLIARHNRNGRALQQV
jgi:hypothetical protein